MAGGYELAYRRLAATPFIIERWERAVACIPTIRPLRHEFKLLTPVDNEPPKVLPLWTLVSDDFTEFGETTMDPQYSGEPHLWERISDGFFHLDALKPFVRRTYASGDPLLGVKPVYPCEKDVIIDGRGQGRGKKYQQNFGDWLRDTFYDAFVKKIRAREDEIRREVFARMDKPDFKEEAVTTLEELAVEELAQRMTQFSKVPNVIERAAKLFVVLDVMEG